AEGNTQRDARERLSLLHQLWAALRTGALEARAVLGQLARFAADEDDEVALAPIEMLTFAVDEWAGPQRQRAREFGAAIYRPVLERLGWTPDRDEPHPRRQLRIGALRFLALVADDAQVRKRAAQLGRAYLAGGDLHPEA